MALQKQDSGQRLGTVADMRLEKHLSNRHREAMIKHCHYDADVLKCTVEVVYLENGVYIIIANCFPISPPPPLVPLRRPVHQGQTAIR